MAFSVSNKQIVSIGNKIGVMGTYNAASVTGGNIETGLSCVESMLLTPTKNAVTSSHSVNETLPFHSVGGAVTIVTGSSETGCFLAIGY